MEELQADVETRIEQAQKLTAKVDEEILQLTETMDTKMFEQRRIENWLADLKYQKYQVEFSLIYERNKLLLKMDLLQQLLDKLRFSDKAYQKKPIKSCLSAQEMNKHKLHFRMVHGSKSFTKEKQLLKEVKVSQQEDSFGSFWTELDERLSNSENTWYWHHLKQTWWLHHQVPFSIHKRDSIEDREGNIKELEGRIQNLDIVLQKHGDEAITSYTAKANFYSISTKPWTSVGAKKALQEQVKHPVNEVNELRKTIETKIREAERKLQALKRDTESLREKFRKAHLCLSKLQKAQRRIDKRLAGSCV